MSHVYRRIFIFELFNQKIIDKISVLHEMLQISHTHKNRNFKSIIGNCFNPVNFMAGAFEKSAISFFAVVDP